VIFDNVLSTIEAHGRTIWLGQSVDTSTIHDGYKDFGALPILTSVGCVIRRPRAVSEKFDDNLRNRIGAKNRLMVDSGGFVLMNKQNPNWNVSRVAHLYNRIDADYLVSLDVPPSIGDSRTDRARKYKKTLQNLEKLFGQFGEKVVPVVHGATVQEIEKNCRLIQSLYPSPMIVGIGGLVPTIQRCGAVTKAGPQTPQRRIAEALGCTRAYFPQSRIHMFGVGSLHTVLGAIAIGAGSVDSIGWRQAAGFGSVYIPGRHRRLLTLRERERPCRPFASDDDIELLGRCRCPVCRIVQGNKIDRLASHYKPRAVHNIWVLYSEIADYLRASQRGKGMDFLSKRLSDAWLNAISH
jgi:tRNA-guanine family transglycosylase